MRQGEQRGRTEARARPQHRLTRPRGFEPLTFGSVDRRSIQLSYGRKYSVRALHVRQPPETAVASGFLSGSPSWECPRVRGALASRPASRPPVCQDVAHAGSLGRILAPPGFFGFQLLDPAAWSHFYRRLVPFFRLVLAALFAVVHAHRSIRSALLAPIRVCSQRSRPDLRPSTSTLDRMVGTSARRRRGRDQTDATKREQPRTGAEPRDGQADAMPVM
jgi:hypothetical protein